MALNIDNSDTQEAVSNRLDLANLTNDNFLGNPIKQRAYSEFVELFLDFNQESGKASNYTKRLDMSNAVATVEYDYEGTHYTRESFASYPDQAIVTKVKSEGGILDFSAQLHTWLKGGQQFEKISDNEITYQRVMVWGICRKLWARQECILTQETGRNSAFLMIVQP